MHKKEEIILQVLKNPFPFSFDTVKFCIPFCSQSDMFSFLQGFRIAGVNTKFKKDGSKLFQSKRFRLISQNDMSEAKSYSSDTLFSYSEKKAEVWFELNCPKYLWGHNCLMLFDFWGFFSMLQSDLESISGYSVKPFQTWRLLRIDLSYNFILPSYKEVMNVLNYFKNFRYKNKKSLSNSEEPYFPFRDHTVKLYSKFNDIEKHKEHFYVDDVKLLQTQSRNILRFEEEWRSEYLYRKLGIRPVTLGMFYVWAQKNFNFAERIDYFFGDVSKKVQYDSIESVYNCVRLTFGRKFASFNKFLTQVVFYGIDKTKELYPNRTFYNFSKKFKDAGIDLVLFSDLCNKEKEDSYFLAKNYFIQDNFTNIPDNTYQMLEFMKSEKFFFGKII